MSDAVALRVRSGILEQTGATAAVLQSDTMDHYGNFHVLEHLLHAPPKLWHIGTKTGITLKSYWRQSDNFK